VVKLKSKSGGFTLLEMVVTMAVWILLLAGASHLLLHTSQVSAGVLARQEALENARAAVDALTVNLQMAEEIVLLTDSDGMLRRVSWLQVSPRGLPEWFEFRYFPDAPPGTAQHNRLNFGNNELASHLSELRLTLSADRRLIHITVTSDESLGEPITLTSTVDIRYKILN
jgi:prepilin-type N-terminal cleavage/methylation domain-containing protein